MIQLLVLAQFAQAGEVVVVKRSHARAQSLQAVGHHTVVVAVEVVGAVAAVEVVGAEVQEVVVEAVVGRLACTHSAQE